MCFILGKCYILLVFSLSFTCLVLFRAGCYHVILKVALMIELMNLPQKRILFDCMTTPLCHEGCVLVYWSPSLFFLEFITLGSSLWDSWDLRGSITIPNAEVLKTCILSLGQQEPPMTTSTYVHVGGYMSLYCLSDSWCVPRGTGEGRDVADAVPLHRFYSLVLHTTNYLHWSFALVHCFVAVINTLTLLLNLVSSPTSFLGCNLSCWAVMHHIFWKMTGCHYGFSYASPKVRRCYHVPPSRSLTPSQSLITANTNIQLGLLLDS